MTTNAEDGFNLIRTMTRHLMFVKSALLQIIHSLENRRDVHDASKFSKDEFPGFVTINKVAREHAYGSDEYKESLRGVESVPLHFSRNRHHPEFYTNPKLQMTFLDITEMVCDWYGAWLSYNSEKAEKDRQSWAASIELQRKRFSPNAAKGLSVEQWWLIDEVAKFLELQSPQAKEGTAL